MGEEALRALALAFQPPLGLAQGRDVAPDSDEPLDAAVALEWRERCLNGAAIGRFPFIDDLFAPQRPLRMVSVGGGEFWSDEIRRALAQEVLLAGAGALEPTTPYPGIALTAIEAEDDVIHPLDECSKPLLARSQSVLRAAAIGDLDHDRAQPHYVARRPQRIDVLEPVAFLARGGRCLSRELPVAKRLLASQYRLKSVTRLRGQIREYIL